MVKLDVPEKNLQNVDRTLQSKVTTESHFWPLSPLLQCKVLTRTDLWVYNSNFFVFHFLTKLPTLDTWEGVKSKTTFLGHT